MNADFTVNSEDLDHSESLNEIGTADSADLSSGLACNFLKIIGGSSTYVLVEAVSAGGFTWVFSINGKVTSTQGQYLQAGQRAEAYARADKGEVVGINCGF